MRSRTSDQVAGPLELLDDEVHVWHVDQDRLSWIAGALRAVLSVDERARADRFHLERDSRRFVVARAALRVLLGRYLDVVPQRVFFLYGQGGKPAVCGGASDGLAFNVSHSGGQALVAFARHRSVGIDLERVRSVPEMEAVAEGHFSRSECAALRALSPCERSAGFFRCWTRKEAFLKATGIGLAGPLHAFDVTLRPGEPARLLRVEGRPEEASRWWLETLAVEEGFHAALAVEGRPSRIEHFVWHGLEDERYGTRRERGQDDLQGGAEPRGAVLDLARRPGERAGLA